MTGLFRRNFHRICLQAVGLSFAAAVVSQETGGLNNVYEVLQRYSCAHAQQERLFVFLNSGFYYPGEHISFKAVLFDAGMQIKSDGSRFFYLQLLNSSGTAVGNYACELHNGEYSGMIRLPDTLVTGLYTLKAYTRWMLNYSTDNYFRRPVLVISPLGGPVLQSTLCDSLPLQFWPEGGRLVAGIENTVLARKNPCLDEMVGLLNLMDDMGKLVLSFTPDERGTTVFSFIPELGRQYRAVTTDTIGPVRIFDLPLPQPGGYGMHLESDAHALQVRVRSADTDRPDHPLYLAVMTGKAGKSVVRPIDPSSRDTAFTFPLAELPEGISQLALFSNDSVLCGRLWYRKNERIIPGDTDRGDSLQTRQDHTGICPSDPDEEDTRLLAVSLNEYNMLTDSLIFDELRYFSLFDLYSSVSDPGVLPLFDIPVSETEINNCLMATEKCLSMEFALRDTGKWYAREVQGIILSGRVIFPSTLEPVQRASVLLSCPDSVAFMNYSITNDDGEFSFTLNDKWYNRKVFIIAEDYPKDRNPVTVIPDDPFLLYSPAEALQLEHSGISGLITGHQHIAMAFRIFYSGKAPSPEYHTSPSYHEDFYGKPDFTLVTAEYEALPDIFEIRKNLVPRLRLKVKDEYCQMTIFDDYLQMFFDHEAFVLLNNIPYPSFKNVVELNSDVIRSIELKCRKFFYDNYLMYGIVSIKTRKPVEIEPHYSYRVTSADLLPEAFEAFSVKVGNGTTLPDVRHSLYWETRGTLPGEAPAFRFRTSDIRGKYLLKVYSVTGDGKLYVAGREFTVL